LGAHFERLLKSAGQKVASSKPVLEINPEHALVQRLKGESDAQRFGDWSRILFDQALLSEGGQLDDPSGFVARVNNLWLGLMK
jgi:molecular chaperone HtpG